MELSEFIQGNGRYSFSSLHPVFSYKSIHALMYWLKHMNIPYTTNEKADVIIENGVTFTARGEGKSVYINHKLCYPSKIYLYRIDSPFVLCSYDDDIQGIYLPRFAPGLFSLITIYKKLDGFERYIDCDEDTMNLIRTYIPINQTGERQVDVLFVVGRYDARAISGKVSLGPEVVIFEYEVPQDESFNITREGSAISIHDGKLVISTI